MAVRSGAGTGVIVSLVVFIMTTVAMLVVAIVFYTSLSEANDARESAERELNRFIAPAEQNQDRFQRHIAGATQQNVSVAAYLDGRIRDTMRYVDGDPNATLDRTRSRLMRFGVGENDVVANVLQEQYNTLEQRGDRLAELTGRLERREDELSQLNQQIASMRQQHRDELDFVRGRIEEYRLAAEDYLDELNRTKRTMEESVDRLRDRYEGRVDELVDETDDLNREIVVLRDRLDDLQQRVSADRIRAQDPDTLVDGRVIEVSGARDQVFINRGRAHRIVLGMTFEVYENASAIRVDPQTGEMRRGKASIQVINVGERTATCKVIRSVPGRPVVPEDVIANAVYDPDYRFKFLVHGRFDIDGDGRATQAEADYIRSLVMEWGGEVVSGDQLPGDLDFLVLGVEPTEPLPPGPDATQAMIDDWAQDRAARETYLRLFRQARDAQIPVLNHNRFLILIGHTPR
ncbi:MAG: hypothetical protein EA377_09400 [Phycisphaerales bacterium]|nr:MAG: hypothetical protein EA377_09400 [Phycisphaerales bacterium]